MSFTTRNPGTCICGKFFDVGSKVDVDTAGQVIRCEGCRMSLASLGLAIYQRPRTEMIKLFKGWLDCGSVPSMADLDRALDSSPQDVRKRAILAFDKIDRAIVDGLQAWQTGRAQKEERRKFDYDWANQ